MFQFSLLELIYLFSAFHGVFLMILLVSKKRSVRKNLFLILMIAFFTFYLVENVIYLSGYLVNVPHLYFTSLPLLFLLGPMFYHYVRDNLEPYEPLAAKHLSHLIPFIMEFLILLPFYLLSSEIKLKVYENSLTSTGDNDWNIYFIGYLIYIASTIGFVFSAFLKLKQSTDKKFCVFFSIFIQN